MIKMTEEKQFYTMHEIANMLSVEYNTVWRWIKAGKLESVKLNSIVRVSKKAFDKFISSGSRDGQEQPKRNRFSLRGLTSGSIFTDKDLEEARREWENRTLR
jgi:excisionase family DNA binding protein